MLFNQKTVEYMSGIYEWDIRAIIMSPPTQETMLQFDISYKSSIDTGIGRIECVALKEYEQSSSFTSVTNLFVTQKLTRQLKSERLEET